MKLLILLLFLGCAKTTSSPVGSISSMLLSLSQVETLEAVINTKKNIPTIVPAPSSPSLPTSEVTQTPVPPSVVLEVGIRTNVPVATLEGWSKCHSETYAASTSLTTIKSNCSKEKIMLACRQASNPNLLLLAASASRTEVFKTTVGNVMNVSNGVGWYYSDSYSMGFAPPNEPISRSSCDTAPGALHMCWHTGGGSTNSGYRCGSNMGLNNSTYAREIFHSD